MGERNYGRQVIEAGKISNIDSLLDEINKHKEEIDRLQAHMEKVRENGPHSEDLTEQYYNEQVIKNPANNHYTQKIAKEVEKITEIKEELKKISN